MSEMVYYSLGEAVLAGFIVRFIKFNHLLEI